MNLLFGKPKESKVDMKEKMRKQEEDEKSR